MAADETSRGACTEIELSPGPDQRRRPVLAFLLGSLACSSSCATSLSSFQPAHVAPKGHLQAEMGADLSLPTGGILDTIDVGRRLATQATQRPLTEAEQLAVIDAGLNLALNPPALIQHFALAYGAGTNVELALRYAGGGYRLGGRYQLWTQEEDGRGWDLSLGLGVARQSFSFRVGNVLDIVRIDDFVRWTVDVPITFGKRASWYRLWGGPRLLFATASTSLRLDLPAAGGLAAQTVFASAEASGVYFGGQAGVALGYEWVYLGFELNLVQYAGRADLVAPSLGDRSVDLGTFIVYPGFALMGEF